MVCTKVPNNYCYTAGISLGTMHAFTGYFVIKPMSSNIAKTVMTDGNIAMLPTDVDHRIRSIMNMNAFVVLYIWQIT